MSSEKRKYELIGQARHDALINVIADDKYKKLPDDELIKLYKEAQEAQDLFRMLQLTTKLLCNSVYGGFGTNSLRYFNQAVASDITAEGRNVCQLVDKMANRYFSTKWATDAEWFAELKEQFPDIIPEHVKAPKVLTEDMVVYCDTDTISKDATIRTENSILTIEQLFEQSKQSHVAPNGNIFRKVEPNILNYTKEKQLSFDKAKFIIQKRVTKPKWKLKTKSGKEIIVTNDHSMIVFRDGAQKTVKPSEMLITDKILVVHER